MTIAVGRRPGAAQGGQFAPRATLVGCDFPLCDKAIHFPVNMQSSSAQCVRDTIRFMQRYDRDPKISGWTVDTTVDPAKFFCSRHADMPKRPTGTLILPTN
ncbi:hypothetical protein SEA_PATIO_16 [Gordonia phage Patio]|uniref:Uncharacterized protein n=3 Tax=Skysandvirus TaxID=2948912 RepID=A0A2D2W4I6_9CAUD|nr:hypothetical protein KNT76_gp16 [Gordonia phage Patio]YP_010098083.1 hypothetical protein KNU08_gp15 [Gordonia phage Skysand]YP_010103125.1 hypothetical protein KNU64_gp18 [Gordonia Phage Lollipop1437]QRI45255.1 hypothetical protein SEA_ENNEA_19 [Gordonia phage Ennea]QXN74398.1 hypothetical protein SEA_FLOAT294_15 [Gordonia phage Float294]ATS93098.1 hypothetical protein SEA_PATIO_16 [Gordonia phage Patio]AXQ62049.1 hypothetical protein SEA_SKYSAND_15 [Gordonia phage Skysand]QDF19122.1 hyp